MLLSSYSLQAPHLSQTSSDSLKLSSIALSQVRHMPCGSPEGSRSAVTSSTGEELPNCSLNAFRMAPSLCVLFTSAKLSTQPLFSTAVGSRRFLGRLCDRAAGRGCVLAGGAS